MTPYNYHAINTQNQTDRLRERDEIRLAAQVSMGASDENAGPRLGRFHIRRTLQNAFTLLTQGARP